MVMKITANFQPQEFRWLALNKGVDLCPKFLDSHAIIDSRYCVLDLTLFHTLRLYSNTKRIVFLSLLFRLLRISVTELRLRSAGNLVC